MAHGGKETGEHALVRQMEDAFEKGDVRLGDSYFPSFFRIAADIQAGVEGVFRLGQRKVDFRKGKRLSKGDHLMIWKKPLRPEWMGQKEYDSYPASIMAREVKVVIEHPGYRSEPIVVVTTFLDPKEITKADLAELYHYRWYCELDFRSIKSVMQMDMLRSLTPEMVEKEIMATLLAYNLIRQTMCDAAFRKGITPREISFKAAMQTINEYRLVWYADLTHSQLKAAQLHLLDAIASHRVGNRSGRWEPRAVKERPKPHPRLMKPRQFYH